MKGHFYPGSIAGVTALIELVVANPHAVWERAVEAGAIVISTVNDNDTGFRQGIVKDPFGHYWLIERKMKE